MKQLRCQPGDLALIVWSNKPFCIGELVHVLSRSSVADADWIIECVGWCFPEGDIDAHAVDAQLLPLRGNPDATTETRTDTKVPATNRAERAEV